MTFEAAAAASNVAKSTCWEWVLRWRQASADERRTLACLADRLSRPHRSPSQVPADEAARICERRRRTGWSPRRLADEPDIARPHSTVHQVLRRGGCSRRPRPARPAVVRYEWPCPGNLLHMDEKLRPLRGARPRADRRSQPRARAGPAGSTCTRSSTTARASPTRRSTPTSGPKPSPPSPAGRSTGCSSRASSAERLMSDNYFSYTRNRSLRELLEAARSATSAPGPTRRAPTARSSASTRPCSASGPTRSNTPQAMPAATRCHTGSTTTTSAAPTPRSATARPEPAFGTSSGSTARPAPPAQSSRVELAGPATPR